MTCMLCIGGNTGMESVASEVAGVTGAGTDMQGSKQDNTACWIDTKVDI